MTRPVFAPSFAKRMGALWARALLAAALLSLAVAGTAPPVLAQSGSGAAPKSSSPGSAGETATADDEFSKQLIELKKTFSDLSKKFEDSAKNIDRLNNAEAARKEIEELRDQVGQLLGAVADNGAVWSLGAKALARADEKLKSLE